MSYLVDPPEPAAAGNPPPATPAPNSSVPSDVQAKLAETLGVPAESLEVSGEPVSGPEPGEAPAPAADTEEPPFDPNAFRERLAARGIKLDNQTLPRDPAVTPRKGDTWVPLGEVTAKVVNDVAEKLPDSWKEKMAEPENAPAANGPQTTFAYRAAITQRVKRAIGTADAGLSEVETEGLECLAQLIAHIKAGDAGAKDIWQALAHHAQEVADSL